MELFEGPEKKLEVILKASSEINFRRFDRPFWEELLRHVQARIVSSLSNEQFDAYLLSESSLFVWKDRFVLITCGQTTLVRAVAYLVSKIDSSEIAGLFYERKNEVFPHRQQTSFQDDVSVLKSHFDGRAFLFGDDAGYHISLFHLKERLSVEEDSTLEILMHDFDPRVADAFKSQQERRMLARSLSDIIPDYEVDEYFFEPAGYSLNAIHDRFYYTVHVTPQEFGSYVSFETNAPVDPADVVRRLLELLSPRAFDVIRFLRPRDSSSAEKERSFVRTERWIEERYVRVQAVEEDLSCGYQARYAHYCLPRREATRAKRIPLK